METPSLPVAFNITIMSPTYGQMWLYWRGYGVYQINGRHLWTIELPSFKKKHLQSGDMPSESNPAYVISRGTEPTILPSFMLWWKGPQSSLVLNRKHKTSSCWATTPDSITKWNVWDIEDKELGEGSHCLLQIQGTSITTALGWATINSSPTLKARPHNWRR
jgi:hypothetical protein